MDRKLFSVGLIFTKGGVTSISVLAGDRGKALEFVEKVRDAIDEFDKLIKERSKKSKATKEGEDERQRQG